MSSNLRVWESFPCTSPSLIEGRDTKILIKDWDPKIYYG